jgi:glycosyltransferase involved in cell wall biosynthesis
VPTCGRDWIPTLPPVVLSHWPRARRIDHDGLTTVGNWRGYGSVERGGVVYGGRVYSMRPLMGLPALTGERFMTAFRIDPGERRDLAELRHNGWCLLDPDVVAATPGAYRRFVRGSKAEFGPAKSGYVHARCGWFSDRSAAYLASGRPVIAQDTGFGDALPTGRGVVAFSSTEDAVDAIDAVAGDYAGHASAAREIAEEHLDSDRVLGALLDAVGGSA